MNIKKFAENIVGVTGNETSHNGRYINFDGTPYGSKGLARLLLSPGLSANMMLCGLLASPILLSGRTQAACYGLAAAAPKLIGLDLAVRGFANRYLGADVVIDRNGGSRRAGAVDKKYLAMQFGLMPISLGCIAASSGMSAFVMNYYWLSNFARSRIRSGRWTIVEPPTPRIRKPKNVKVTRGKLQPSFS